MSRIQVPITKGKGFIEVETDDIPVSVYAEALLQGMKVLLNRGASKITKTTYPNAEELAQAAMAKAAEQMELVMTEKIKFTGGKAKKASGAVMTEARRLAKALVKDAMKAEGIKISHVAAKDITAMANEILNDPEQGQPIIDQAKANLAEREKTPIKISVKGKIKEDPKLVAKAEEKKAKDQLSAKQAGKVKARTKKPAAQPTA